MYIHNCTKMQLHKSSESGLPLSLVVSMVTEGRPVATGQVTIWPELTFDHGILSMLCFIMDPEGWVSFQSQTTPTIHSHILA